MEPRQQRAVCTGCSLPLVFPALGSNVRVRCPACDTVMRAVAGGGADAELLAGHCAEAGCRALLRFPRPAAGAAGAAVRCPTCEAVTAFPPHQTAACGGCAMELSFAAGAAVVRCAACAATTCFFDDTSAAEQPEVVVVCHPGGGVAIGTASV